MKAAGIPKELKEGEYGRYMEEMEGIAIRAGEIVAAELNNLKSLTHKGSVDVVTEIDVKVEKLITSHLNKCFPDVKVLGEEEATGNNAEYQFPSGLVFCVDPIDGTTNFVHGFLQNCISIGLAKDGVAIAGIVYNPHLQQMYSAVIGKGAYCNQERIHCSQSNALKMSLISTNFGYSRSEVGIQFMQQNMVRLLSAGVAGIRMQGSAAMGLCYVANGSMDSFFEWGLHPWDICAGIIIVQESGGIALTPTAQCKDIHHPINLMDRCVLCGPRPVVQDLIDTLDFDCPREKEFCNC